MPKSESQAMSLFPASFTANSLKSSLPKSSMPLTEIHYSPPSLAALCRDHQNTWCSFLAPWFSLLFSPPNTAIESSQNANHDVISFINFPRPLGWDGVMIPQLGSQGHHRPVLPAGQSCSSPLSTLNSMSQPYCLFKAGMRPLGLQTCCSLGLEHFSPCLPHVRLVVF